MTFGEPHWFWALLALPLLVAFFFYNERRRRELVRRVVAPRLEPRLAATVSATGRVVRFVLLLVGLTGVIFALAQPRWGYTWEESKRRGRDVLIAVDVSKSMLATDLTPTRLGRAKLAVQDLIGQLTGDRVGLIAFAGTAFLQAPLTVDHSAVLNALQELDTEIIPLGGTNIASAIRTARDAFGKGESDHRALIVFTDGEELEDDAAKAAEKIKETVRIFTVGLGSNDGSLIPLVGEQSGDFVKDPKGQIVKSRLDEERLRTIAESTGGFYLHLLGGRADIDKLVHDGLGEMNAQDIDAKLSRQPIERYQWPLGFGLAALALSMLVNERRRAAKGARAMAAALCACVAIPTSSSAKNDGVRAYEQRNYDRALKAFTEQLGREPHSAERQFNVGSAAYQKGDLEHALEAFSHALTSPDPGLRAKAEYNLGNTLFQRGAAQKKNEPKIQDWRNALQHYEQALKVEPHNADAAYNADVVRKMLEQLEKEQQQQQQQQKQNEKDDKQQQKKDDKNKSQQNSSQQQQQQQNGGKEKREQQSDGSAEPRDSENQKGEQEKKDDASGKDEEKKKAGSDGDEKEQANDGKEEKKDGKNGDEQSQENEPQSKKEGELANAPEYGKQPGESEGGEPTDGAIEVEGKMSPAQARALLDSLRGEDDRVQLLNPRERKVRGRVLRDW